MKTVLLSSAALIAATGAGVSADTTDSYVSNDEVRSIVAEMLADAETRSSMLQSGTAGHDGSFFLADSAGNFRLEIGGQIQYRYMANFRDESAAAPQDDFESGFSSTRTALSFEGHIFEPNLFYKVQGNFNEAAGGTFGLEDAYFGYNLEDGWTLLAGQLRMPVLWEDMLWEQYGLAVDQSVVNAVFAQGRSQGAWVHYEADDWRMWFGASDGARSANTDFTRDPADYALTFRAEAKIAGEWSQFNSFSSAPGSEYGAKIGAAVHYQDGPNGSPLLAETEFLAYTADAMAKGDGWNAFVQFVGTQTDSAGAEFDDFGFVVQGGMFLPDSDNEIFARWDIVMPDDNRANHDNFNTITFGVNHYMHGQAAKLTFDVAWYLEATTDNDLVNAAANAGIGNQIGLLPTDEDNQFALRLQFQLLF